MSQIPAQDWYPQGSLANGTYHLGLGGEAGLVQSASFFWDSALIGTIQIWTCDYPSERVAISDVTAGRWIQQQPTAGYTAISPAGAATLGASPLLITIPGGTAGGCNIQLGNLGSRRVKAILGVTTPGVFTYGFCSRD